MIAEPLKEIPAPEKKPMSPVAPLPFEPSSFDWKRWRWPLSAMLVVALVIWFVMPRPVQVTYAQVRQGPMTLSIAASGKVDGDSCDLSFMGNGQIIEQPVREGEVVEAGQILARLNHSDFSGTDDVIQSPYDGYVVTLYRKVGEVVSSSVPVLRVVRREGAYVTTFLDSEDAAWVRPGDRFICRAGGYLASPWSLRVATIGHEAVQRDDIVGSARQVRAQLVVLDKGFSLPIGTDVDVDGEVEIATDALQVPASAVVRQEDRTFVWRVAGEHVQPVDVTLGPNNFRFVVITRGVEKGDKIVVEGKTDLKADEKVNARLWQEASS